MAAPYLTFLVDCLEHALPKKVHEREQLTRVLALVRAHEAGPAVSDEELEREEAAASARVPVPTEPRALRWEWLAVENVVGAARLEDPASSVPMIIDECVSLAGVSAVEPEAEREWQEQRWTALGLPGVLPPPFDTMFPE